MYRRVRLLGRGYFGEVWLERDLGLNRLCAAKYLNGPGSTNSLLDPFAEARAMLQAEHDYVVQVFSAELENGIPVIRMEYLADGSVADVHGDHPLPVGVAARLVEDACRGLECLHARRLLHRDLKPANLMLTGSGAVKVSDFGLACRSDQAAQVPIGYMPHLPPEVLPEPGYIESVEGDVYAIGVTLYRLVNGDGFLADAQATGSDIRSLISAGALPPRDKFEAHVHEALRRVIRKATHQDPAKRFGTAYAMRHAVEAARPKVSWRVTGAGEDVAWNGESVDGSAEWQATLHPASRGTWVFRIERRLRDKAFRTVNADSGQFADRGIADKHAGAVLRRIAAEGR